MSACAACFTHTVAPNRFATQTWIPFRVTDWMVTTVMLQLMVRQWMSTREVRELGPMTVCRTSLTSLRLLQSSSVNKGRGWCEDRNACGVQDKSCLERELSAQ